MCKNIQVSFIQRQFWLAQQIAPESAAYNVASGFVFEGAFDPAAFTRALTDIVARHEVLRTTYEMGDSGLVQVVSEEPRIALVEHCIESDARDSFESISLHTMNDAAATPFDLKEGPVVRLVLIKGGCPTLNAACVVVHHIAIDLRSKDLFAAELSRRYSAMLQERAGARTVPSRDEAVDQYRSYCEWQHAWMSSEDAGRMMAYWKNALADATLSLPLQTDLPRPSAQTFKGDLVSFRLRGSRFSALERVCGENRIDPYLFLLAAYYVTLHRYTRVRNFVIGVPLTNRREARFKDMMGCFVNTVPLSVVIDPSESVLSLVRKVRVAMLGAHRNQEMPIERLVGAFPSQDKSRNPLYQVGYTFEHPMALELDNVAVTPCHCETGGAQLELFLRCWRDRYGIEGQLEYNSALFQKDTATRLVNRFETAVAAMANGPATLVGDIAAVPHEEMASLVRWNETDRAYPLRPLGRAFEEQVARTPDAVALSLNGQTMTYAALDRRANQVASYLRSLGVEKGDVVPLVVERSFEMWLGIYAIVKLGAAYVPIETHYPQNRIAYMLAELSPKCVLATTDTLEKLPVDHCARVVDLQACAAELDAASAAPPEVTVALTDTAYVIFTSGSTGRPKGVMNSHAGIANRLCWMQEAFPLSSADRVLAKTPYGFDVSVWEIFWPLQVGASIVIAPPDAHRDPSLLAALFVEERISTVHFVPSMLEAFLSHRWGDDPPALKRVICSGEALPRDLQDRFFERFSGVALHNLYGPTEAAVDVTHWPCEPGSTLPFVPIGRAIANTKMYVLDDALRPTGVGVPGEICIGGVQVAKGYWQNPSLTEAQFVADPFAGNDARLYRTGDLGRFLPDGSIQFLGRIDHQVKIRGNRIEFGEIEAVLRSYPSVRDAAVVAKSVDNRPLSLVAFVSSDGRDWDALRAHVSAELPDYMIPSLFVPVAELPLTGSGKIDRKALMEIDVSAQAPRVAAVPPATAVEKRVAEIWTRVLGTDRFGRTDNFFDIGGSSILLMRVLAALRDAYGDRVTAAALFQYTTLERLAGYLQEGPCVRSECVEKVRERAMKRINNGRRRPVRAR